MNNADMAEMAAVNCTQAQALCAIILLHELLNVLVHTFVVKPTPPSASPTFPSTKGALLGTLMVCEMVEIWWEEEENAWNMERAAGLSIKTVRGKDLLSEFSADRLTDPRLHMGDKIPRIIENRHSSPI